MCETSGNAMALSTAVKGFIPERANGRAVVVDDASLEQDAYTEPRVDPNTGQGIGVKGCKWR